ncbi:MAG: DNA repair protein RadA [Eubacterium sp.]|jgi:DNA repair protein RadA/Sms|nr:DNA repair protein RadA [Eubacterium sp.]
MSKKPQTVWVCQECGYESPKWLGRCICGAFGSMVEETVVPDDAQDTRRRVSAGSGETAGGAARPKRLKKVGSAEYARIKTGIRELDRVLGGGLVPGSLTLISGEPGIGKSTLIIQAAAKIAAQEGTVLYVSGEESEEQIKMRADRVCGSLPDSLLVMAETNMENIMAVSESCKPKFLIIDSIQTIYSDTLDSAPGSVSQVRTCGNMLMKIGKSWNVPVFIVAHVTKSGELAGPKTVEHLVDTVLHFSGERDHEVRILRAFKNRFGTTSEIGAFRMEERGLMEIQDISATFLENTDVSEEGSVITAVYEGSRPVFLEVQALTSRTTAGFPRRTAVGVDQKRLAMILAVLEKKLGLNLSDQDVYVNIVGGLRADRTSVDLGVALAIYSTIRGAAPSRRVVAFGEVGLTGELRSVQNADRIVMEAARLGYQQVILPERSAERIDRSKIPSSCQIAGVKNLYAAAHVFLD